MDHSAPMGGNYLQERGTFFGYSSGPIPLIIDCCKSKVRLAVPRMVRLRDLRRKAPVSVRLDPQVLDWLRGKGEGT
jgi:hypothetical protein